MNSSIYTYIIIINVVGFATYLINMLFNKFIRHTQVELLIAIISFIGGALGVLLAILLFDQKFEKDNMMLRTFIICTFIIQTILFSWIKTTNLNEISFDIIGFFKTNKILLHYLILINIITFITFALDKLKAILGKWRLKTITLLGLCFIGGSIGGLLSMHIFRHKTKVEYFTYGIPIIMVMQSIFVIFLINIIK